MLPGHSSWGSGPVWEKLWSQLLTHCGLLSILGVPAQEPETVSRATAPTDQPAGGKGMWKRVPVGGPCFMVWVSRKERSEMLGQVSWGGGGRPENLWGTEVFWRYEGTGRQSELQG